MSPIRWLVNSRLVLDTRSTPLGLPSQRSYWEGAMDYKNGNVLRYAADHHNHTAEEADTVAEDRIALLELVEMYAYCLSCSKNSGGTHCNG